MSTSFVGVLKAIGADFEKGLVWAVKYAVPVERLVALLFPLAAPAATGVADATVLIQNSVLQVEQKYAAMKLQNGTGAQKSAEVVTLAGQAVIALLAKDGIKADAAYVSTLVTAIASILNVQAMPTTGGAASA